MKTENEYQQEIKHVYRSFDTIRSINRLLVVERNPDTLAKRACELLVKGSGYTGATVMLDAGEGIPEVLQSSGWSNEFQDFSRKRTEGWYPPCVNLLLTTSRDRVVLTYQDCEGCPLRQASEHSGRICIRIQHDDIQYGYLTLTQPPGMSDEQETSLVQEVAGDIGLALHIISTEARAHREAHQNQAILSSISDGFFALDDNLVMTFFNPAAEKLLGRPREEVLGREIFEAFPEARGSEFETRYRRAIKTRQPDNFEFHFDKPPYVNWYFTRIYPQPGGGISVYFTVETEKKDTEHALRKSERLLNETGDLAQVGGWELDLNTNRVLWTQTTRAIHEVPDDYEPHLETAIDFYPPEARKQLSEALQRTQETGVPWELELPFITAKGRNLWTRSIGKAEFENGTCIRLYGAFQDITERKNEELSRIEAETQLRHIQKLDSIGRLAGGVAHDFNNLLMGIMGHIELCCEEIEPNHPIRESLDAIMADSQRSANLTRQLLAFARKQTIEPQVLDLNDSISGMLKLLQHLIGEQIDLTWSPGASLWTVKIDPSQIDQVLANLCVNARDAINGVGKITIHTHNIELDKTYCATHVDAEPGAYVCLTVSDTGCGMDEETLEKIFEPFFTTKPIGEGTGLGLSTLHGIVKQNTGHIHAYSEPGKGTTFRIYLPRDGTLNRNSTTAPDEDQIPGGTETLLLVEDEKSARNVLKRTLNKLGYTVLDANEPKEALTLAAEHRDEINLLITDIVMPEMNGRELAEKLSQMNPEIDILYMSGYTADVITHDGVLDENFEFLSKPFTRKQIAQKVRKVLDC